MPTYLVERYLPGHDRAFTHRDHHQGEDTS
jgi:hypothetical protein